MIHYNFIKIHKLKINLIAFCNPTNFINKIIPIITSLQLKYQLKSEISIKINYMMLG
jgi:hypothetical protein